MSKNNKYLLGDLPEGEQISLDKTTIIVSQEAYDSEDFEEMQITTEDEGGGIFYSIKTERWAFNDIEELAELLQKFINMSESFKTNK